MIYNVFFMFMRLFMITIIISSGSTADKKKVSSPPFVSEIITKINYLA